MKLIGFTSRQLAKSNFVDGVIHLSAWPSMQGDYFIDLSFGELIADPREWIARNDDPNVGAFYGDFLDKENNYVLQAAYPSIRGKYPGVIFKGDVLRRCVTNSPLDEIAKSYVISYIPDTFFRIHV